MQYIGSLDVWRQEISVGEAAAYVPVDADDRLLKFLHLSLAGTPRSSGRRPLVVRLWASAPTVIGLIASYLLLLGTFDLRPPWGPYSVAASFAYLAGHFSITECTMIMAQTMPQPRADGGNAFLTQGMAGGAGLAGLTKAGTDRQKEEFMELLLATRVTETCAAEVRGWLIKSYINVIPVMSALWYMISTLQYDLPETSTSGYFVQLLATGVYWLCTLPFTMILSGWLLYMHVPCVIVRERIRQMTAVVRDMRGSERNYNVVMNMVQDAHESTLRLSALVTPTMAVNAGISFSCASFMLVGSVLPRPECDRLQVHQPAGCGPAVDGVANLTAPHAWQQMAFFEITRPWVFATLSICFFINTLIPLLSAANTSAAVDELIDAVGTLRYELTNGNGPGGAAVNEQATLVMSPPMNLLRVDGLQQYAAELNSGQGLGFTFFKIRIDKNWVRWVLLQGLALFAVVQCEGELIRRLRADAV